MNPLVHLHPATVHFPIALLLVASGAGLLHLLWRPLPWLRVLTWATMALGWLGAAVAILTGLLAQSGLPPQADYRPVLNLHISAALGVLVLYGLLLYMAWMAHRAAARPPRRGPGGALKSPPADLLLDDGRKWLLVGLLLLGMALVALAGWNGGQLVYQFGVNVGQ
jgi:uncharacterized membrane protein